MKVRTGWGFLLMILLGTVILSGCSAVSSGSRNDTGTETETTAASGTDQDGFYPVDDAVETVRDGVNVREEPEDSGKVSMTLDKGVQMERTGTKDAWTRVLLNGRSCYVRSDDVKDTVIHWATEQDTTKVKRVIFLDPAKQITENAEEEYILPQDSTESKIAAYTTPGDAPEEQVKEKMSRAAVGVSTGNFEYDITLDVAAYLAEDLKTRGYTVTMSRTTDNVNISNADRAELANAAGADLYLRLQAGSTGNAGDSGMTGFITTSRNPHTKDSYQQSYELCYDVLKEASAASGLTRLGICETDRMTSLNYCNMPAASLNMGFLSNASDDQQLGDPAVQKKIADGIADGIDEYFQNVEGK